jgi:hypothetical protein
LQICKGKQSRAFEVKLQRCVDDAGNKCGVGLDFYKIYQNNTIFNIKIVQLRNLKTARIIN